MIRSVSTLFRACVPAAALLITASSASAEVIDFTGLGKSAAISATLTQGTTTYVRNVSAGELNWSWIGATPEGFATSFYSYCIDLVNYLVDPQTVTVGSSEGFTNGVVDGGAKAAWLFNTFAAGIHAAGTGIQAAALQIAIWEAMYDRTGSLTDGDFRLATTGAIATQATAYLNALYSGGSYPTSVAAVLDTQRGQDQVTSRVSEPSTLLLLGAGLALVARRARKLQSRAS